MLVAMRYQACLLLFMAVVMIVLCSTQVKSESHDGNINMKPGHRYNWQPDDSHWLFQPIPPDNELPGASWSTHDTGARNPHAIAMLLGFSNHKGLDKYMTAIRTVIQLHASYGTAADIAVFVYGTGGKQLPFAFEQALIDAAAHPNNNNNNTHVRVLQLDLLPLFRRFPVHSEYLEQIAKRQGQESVDPFPRLIQYGKFFVFHDIMAVYKRVLFTDADIQPLGNFDHYWEIPFETRNTCFVVAGRASPANGGFFMIQPNMEVYRMLMGKASNSVSAGNVVGKPQKGVFHENWGWGRPSNRSMMKTVALTWAPGQIQQRWAPRGWSFMAANYDQGLLWYFCMWADRCLRVRRMCKDEEDQCFDAQLKHVQTYPEGYLERQLKNAVFCGWKMMDVVRGLEESLWGRVSDEVKRLPLTPREASYFPKLYRYDFAHYAGPSHKPWNHCSAVAPLIAQMAVACLTVETDFQVYCDIWRESANIICEAKKSISSSSNNSGGCHVGCPLPIWNATLWEDHPNPDACKPTTTKD